MAVLAAEGPMFAVGSDAHDITRLAAIQSVWDAVERLGLPPERIWRPQVAPGYGSGR